MSSFWKGVALTFIILLGVVFLYNLFNRSTSSESTIAARDQMTARYNNYLEKHDKRDIGYFQKAEEQIAKVNDINERSLQNQERFERLLDRWERQADRIDSLLSKYEEK